MKESLSLQIYKDLYEKINCHFYKQGQQLPIEQDLEKHYQVSRAPVRQAMAKLESDGLIIRQAGKGTFVSAQGKKEKSTSLGGFGIHFVKYARQLACKTLKFEELTTSKAQEQELGFPVQTPLVFISRVRLMGHEPIFFLNHYIANFDIEKIKGAGNIPQMREFLQENGIDIDYVSEKIKAVVANEQLSAVFEVPIGYPLLKINRTSFNQDYKQIIYEIYYVKSDIWDYEVQFGVTPPK